MGVRGGWVFVASLVLAGLGALFLLSAMAVFHLSRGWGYDFAAYYGAALRLLAGEGIYQPETLAGPFRPGPGGLYLYSPVPALLVAPLTAVPFDDATVLWLVIRVALLAAACALMPVPAHVRAAAFGVASFSFPVLIDLDLGNVSTVVMALTVFVWRWLDRIPGSFALAAAMTMRPTLGLIAAWWLVRRRPLPVLWTAAAGIAIVLATLPFVGLTAYVDYLTVLRNVGSMTGVPNNLDLGSTVLTVSGKMGIQVPGWLPAAALFGGYLVAIVAMALSLRRDAELSFVVTSSATLVLSPLLWDHYLVSLLIPAAFLAARGRGWGLSLPLLGWLPQEVLPFVALAGVVLPFLARAPSRPAALAASRAEQPRLAPEPA